MKKIIVLTVFILLCCKQSFAQSIPFKKLDSVSTLISKWQKQAEGRTYKDINDNISVLSFPQENFKVWSYNKLATHAVYKQQADKEVLALTENIDFSKAIGISWAEDYNDKVSYIKVDFPEGSLNTQVIENGSMIETLNASYLELFCEYVELDSNKITVPDQLFDKLFLLISELKIEKGLEQDAYIRKMRSDWDRMTSEEFLAKYPSSIMASQAKQILQRTRFVDGLRLKLQSSDKIENIIIWMRAEKSRHAEYDIFESEINSFGYYLMESERLHDALMIFMLNSELYPKSFNTWDSLGECLLKLNRKEEGLAAYRKSLKLNPGNDSAIEALNGQN